MGNIRRTDDSSLDRLREEATDDRSRDQIDAEKAKRDSMKESADKADSEQGVGEGVKSSGDVKN